MKSETDSRPLKEVTTLPSLRNSIVAAHLVSRPGGLPITYEYKKIILTNKRKKFETSVVELNVKILLRLYEYYK